MPDAIDTMIEELNELDPSVREKGRASGRRPYHYKIDPETLHKIHSQAGKIGGIRGGRKGGRKIGKPSGRWPKGFTHTPGDLERVNAKLPKKAFLMLKDCATYDGKTIQQFVYDLANTYRQDSRYEHLFATPKEQHAKENAASPMVET